MNEYVLVHVSTNDIKTELSHRVLLVRKNKPAWQKGKLNLVGGKKEAGETPEEAAYRELEEETGIAKYCEYMTLCGEIWGTDCIVYCFSCNLIGDAYEETWGLHPREEETETVRWYFWHWIVEDPSLIPNLRIIIPLLQMKSKGWTIIDQVNTMHTTYGLKLELDIEKPFVDGD